MRVPKKTQRMTRYPFKNRDLHEALIVIRRQVLHKLYGVEIVCALFNALHDLAKGASAQEVLNSESGQRS